MKKRKGKTEGRLKIIIINILFGPKWLRLNVALECFITISIIKRLILVLIVYNTKGELSIFVYIICNV